MLWQHGNQILLTGQVREEALPPPMKRFIYLAHKMSQNMDLGTGSSSSSDGSQLSKYNSTCWRWKIITSQLLMLLIRWTSGTTEWTFMTNCPSSLKTFLLRLQVRRTLKGVFLCAACLLLVAETEWPSLILKCELVWNWTKNIGEHRHQRLCVNFGTVTLIEINCK